MTPFEHSILSVRDFGGEVNDYLPIHEFLDSTKAHFSNFMHRAILHNSFGMILCEQMFGTITRNKISVREVARRHIEQDMGEVPSIERTLQLLTSNKYHELNKPNRSDLEYLKNKLYEY